MRQNQAVLNSAKFAIQKPITMSSTPFLKSHFKTLQTHREIFISSNISNIEGFNVADVNPKELCPLLLFGDQNLGTVANRIISEATISFIKASASLN